MLQMWSLTGKRAKKFATTLENKKKKKSPMLVEVKPRMDKHPFSDRYHMQNVSSKFPYSQQTALFTATKSKASF